jgi:hypothetical protein
MEEKRVRKAGLDLQVVKSQQSGNTIKIVVRGRIGALEVEGESFPLHLGLTTLSRPGLASDIVDRVHRADGFGKPLPIGARMQLEKEVRELLSRLDEESASR